MWNVPWEYKCPNGVTKGLLRDSVSHLLPHEIAYRKKSPYPKTYDPAYEEILKQRVRDIINNTNSPIYPIINKAEIKRLTEEDSDYGKPWFGQLMAKPQLFAYIIQVNYWLDKFSLTL